MYTSQLHDRTPFVYIIRDITNGKRYGGVKFSKGCRPSDLLTKYYTSSRIVKNLIKDGKPSPRKDKKDAQIQCKHCGKFANRGNYNRWHGDNCKMRGHNTNDPHLSLNTTAAEVTTDDSVDPDSTGFIVNQVAATNINVTGATYIYLAIA